MPSLRSAAIKLAYEVPKLRGHILPLIEKMAISKDTEDFVEWALNTQQPMNPRAVQKFIEGKLRIETKPPKQKRQGPRFQEGDRVEVDVSKHKDAETLEVYKQFDGQVGTVTGVSGMDAIVRMDRGGDITFPLAQKSRGVGLMKFTPAFVAKGNGPIEMIYIAGGQPTKDQQMVVKYYSDRAKGGEKRSANYYTGYVFSAYMAQGGGWYFQAAPQQRMQVGGGADKGFLWRSFNPGKGKVFYIGIQGKRPSGWKDQIDQIRAQAQAVTASEKMAWEFVPRNLLPVWDKLIQKNLLKWRSHEDLRDAAIELANEYVEEEAFEEDDYMEALQDFATELEEYTWKRFGKIFKLV